MHYAWIRAETKTSLNGKVGRDALRTWLVMRVQVPTRSLKKKPFLKILIFPNSFAKSVLRLPGHFRYRTFSEPAGRAEAAAAHAPVAALRPRQSHANWSPAPRGPCRCRVSRVSPSCGPVAESPPRPRAPAPDSTASRAIYSKRCRWLSPQHA